MYVCQVIMQYTLNLYRTGMSIILENLKKKKKQVSFLSQQYFFWPVWSYVQTLRFFSNKNHKKSDFMWLEKVCKSQDFIMYFKLKKKKDTSGIFYVAYFYLIAFSFWHFFWRPLTSCLCVMTLERTCMLGVQGAHVQETQPHQRAVGLPAPLCYWPHQPSTWCDLLRTFLCEDMGHIHYKC